MPRPTTSELRDAARILRDLADRVGAGELTAPTGMRSRLEGAAAALDALTKRSSRRAEPPLRGDRQ